MRHIPCLSQDLLLPLSWPPLHMVCWISVITHSGSLLTTPGQGGGGCNMPQCAILPLGKPGLRTSSIAGPCRGDWQQLATSPRQDSGLGTCLFPRLWQPAKLLLRGREAAQVAIVMGPTAWQLGGGGGAACPARLREGSLPGAAARGQLARRGCEKGSLPGAAARRAACPARLREGQLARRGCEKGSLPGAAARRAACPARLREGQLARRGCEKGSLPGAAARRAACPARLREGQLARRGCEKGSLPGAAARRAACPARLREGSLPGAAVKGGAACLDCDNLAMAQYRCCIPAPCGGLHRPVCLLTCAG